MSSPPLLNPVSHGGFQAAVCMGAAMGFTIEVQWLAMCVVGLARYTPLDSHVTLHTGFGLGWNLISSMPSLAQAVSSYSDPICSSAVERVVEYLGLPQEPPAVIESNRPAAYWPSSSNQGHLISIEDLSVKYAPDLPLVLRNINLTLKAKERVGLLGRTGIFNVLLLLVSLLDDSTIYLGSGKSTLATSILRFVRVVPMRAYAAASFSTG
jgi:ABC-type multidrug transport system fused ATPase/permease subunit